MLLCQALERKHFWTKLPYVNGQLNFQCTWLYYPQCLVSIPPAVLHHKIPLQTNHSAKQTSIIIPNLLVNAQILTLRTCMCTCTAIIHNQWSRPYFVLKVVDSIGNHWWYTYYNWRIYYVIGTNTAKKSSVKYSCPVYLHKQSKFTSSGHALKNSKSVIPDEVNTTFAWPPLDFNETWYRYS